MKTKLVRPVLRESKFNSIEEMQGDIILRDNKLYTCEQLNALLLYKKESSDKVFELILVSLEDEKIENGAVFYDKLDNRVMTWNMSHSFPSEYYEYCYKVITRQSQISPDLIYQLVCEYNNEGMQDFEIEMIETYDWSLEEDAINFPIGFKPKLTNGFVTVVDTVIGKPLEDYINEKHSQDRCMGLLMVTKQGKQKSQSVIQRKK